VEKRKPVPTRERQVCERLKEAREHLRFTQAEFASEAGIKRQRLASYEEGRAPLRFDLALRICRQFIISEKWLATGEGGARLLMDLTGENATFRIPADMAFGAAYDKFLSTRYDAICREQGEIVRILPKTDDSPAFWKNLFTMLLDQWYMTLAPKDVSQLLFNLLTGGIVMVDHQSRTGSVPVLVTSEDGTETTFYAIREKDAATIMDRAKKKMLTDSSTSHSMPDVKSQLRSLLERVNHLAQESGKKSELAKFLGAPLASVSRWLSGEREPGGETTLRLLHWVEQQERK
jgi:transcriptional regulator with XRE-family HTH domain